jgi:predicted DsbA family dithiol-disulfide isomerase
MNTKCNSGNADTCWTDVAEGLGLDTDKIESCFDDNKVAYAREQYDLNQILGVGGSPTLFFEGQQYNGARTSNGYLAAICAGFDESDKPSACADVIEESPTAAPPSGSC